MKIIGITGSDGKTTTTSLIYEILKEQKEDVKFLGNIGIPIFEVIEEISKMPKVCDHFHISLQSGCNRTLKAMNRKYTRDQYLELVEKIKKSREETKDLYQKWLNHELD